LQAWQGRVYAAGAGPYIDGVRSTALRRRADAEAFRASVGRLTTTIERSDPGAVVVLGPIALPPDARRRGRTFFEAQMQSLGTAVRMTSYGGSPASIRSALTVAARGADLHGGALVALDERATGLRLSRGGADVTATLPHRLLFSTSTFATFLIYGGAADERPLDVDVGVNEANAPQVA